MVYWFKGLIDQHELQKIYILGGSSSSSRQVKSQPEPTKPRTQEREIKKPVINRPTEDDDIQEVVSVKSEPPPSQQEYQDPGKKH